MKDSKKQLIILGNGFDLACHYETSFKDFIKYEANLKKSTFKFDFFSFVLFNTSGLNSYAVTYMWRGYFSVSSFDEWSDVEQILSKMLFDEQIYNDLYKLYSAILLKKKKKEPLQSLKTGSAVEEDIIDYLEGRNVSPKANNFLNFLILELMSFEESLCGYLEKIQAGKKSSLRRLAKDLLFQDLSTGYEKENIIVLNFNYTIPFSFSNKYNLFYVHGESFDKKIIVGVDPTNYPDLQNEKDIYKKIKNKAYFTKTFRKMNLNGQLERNDKMLDPDVNKITFYGHSLNEQDYSYFQSIFDYYDIYNKDIVLEFCYTKYRENDVLVGLGEQLRKIYKLINEYGQTFDNKEKGKNLLHKILLEGRIVTREINLPNEVIASLEK